MFGFDTSNSIEPAAPARPVAARKPDPEEIPIREATPAEMRAIKSRSAPQVETDAVARRHNLYMAERRSARIYYTDYQQKSEVMRANPDRISTKLDDRQTVSAMLDLAQSRGWQTIKLRGTDSFKREAWVQAQVRGMKTEGYRPAATDLQETERRKAAAQPVTKPAEAAKPAKVAAAQPPPKSHTPKRTDKAAVWGAVETAGKQAREQDASAVKAAEKQPPAAKAAAKPVPVAMAAE